MPKHPRTIGFKRSLTSHWRLVLLEGAVLILLGLLAVFGRPLAPVSTDLLIGWLFLVAGLVGLLTTLAARNHPGFWWSLLSACLAIAVGYALIDWPGSQAMPLSYTLIFFFAVEGFATVMYALEHRRQLTGRWEWMLLSGVIDIALALLVVSGLPGAALWTVSVLVGINLTAGGAAMIAMAIDAHDETHLRHSH